MDTRQMAQFLRDTYGYHATKVLSSDLIECAYKLDTLALYEDALTVDEAIDYGKAKATGRGVMLPCAVGDTVFAYCDTFNRILDYFIEQIIFDYYDIGETMVTFNAICVEHAELLDTIDFQATDIGKTVFRTREAAEFVLKWGVVDE